MTTILDHHGRPVRPRELSREIASPTTTGVRSLWTEAVASGLTPPKLASILREAAEGDTNAYLTLAEEMEERDLHYAGVLRTRKIAVNSLEVQVEAPTEDSKDLKIADQLRELLEESDMRDLIFDMMDAVGKGYSAVEMMWDTSSTVWWPTFEWRDPRFFQFDELNKRKLRLRDDNIQEGKELPPYKFLIHTPKNKTGIPIRGGLARLVSFAHMAKSYSLKDWVAFAEVFGMPIRLGKYSPAATQADQEKLLQAVANIGTDAAAIIPNNMEISFEKAARDGGGAIYAELANYLDKQVSKGVLGQTMTTDDGASLAQAKVHENVREDIMLSDAAQIEDTLTKQLVIPWTILNYGAQAKYCRIHLVIEQQEDLKEFTEAVTPLIDRGLPVEVAQVLDKFSLTEPAEGAAILRPKGETKAEEEPEQEDNTDGKEDQDEEEKAENRTRQRAARDGDLLDGIAAMGLEDWQMQMDPVMSPIFELAKNAKSFGDFEAALNDVIHSMNSEELVRRLATAAFMARGLGDATDEV